MIDSINSTAATRVLQDVSQSKSAKGNEEMNEPKGVPDIDDTAQISKAAQKAYAAR